MGVRMSGPLAQQSNTTVWVRFSTLYLLIALEFISMHRLRGLSIGVEHCRGSRLPNKTTNRAPTTKLGALCVRVFFLHSVVSLPCRETAAFVQSIIGHW